MAKRPDQSNKKLVVIEEEIGEVSRIIYQLERKEQPGRPERKQRQEQQGQT